MRIEQFTEKHCKGVIDLINFYVLNTNYTLVDKEIPYKLFNNLKASEGNVLSLVALENETVLGTAMFKNSGSFALQSVIMSIYVQSDNTNKGIGRALFEEAKRHLTKINKRVILSKVKAENRVSVAFHKTVGFEEFLEDGGVIWFKYELQPILLG